MTERGREDLLCSFCDKDSKDVNKMIASEDACICNECVTFCFEVMNPPEDPPPEDPPP